LAYHFFRRTEQDSTVQVRPLFPTFLFFFIPTSENISIHSFLIDSPSGASSRQSHRVISFMLAATTTTTTSGTADSSAIEVKHDCSTCVATFESKEAKRVHMRDDWQ